MDKYTKREKYRWTDLRGKSQTYKESDRPKDKDGETDRPADGWTKRQTYRKKEKWENEQNERERDRKLTFFKLLTFRDCAQKTVPL